MFKLISVQNFWNLHSFMSRDNKDHGEVDIRESLF